MGTFKFIYDEDNLKELKVICKSDSEKDCIEDILDILKIFCINTIPQELQPEVEDLKEEGEVGYLIKCKDKELGETILTHIFKYIYLIFRMVIIFNDEFSKGSKIRIEDFDFNLLRPDIKKIENLGYHELAALISIEDGKENHVEKD